MYEHWLYWLYIYLWRKKIKGCIFSFLSFSLHRYSYVKYIKYQSNILFKDKEVSFCIALIHQAILYWIAVPLSLVFSLNSERGRAMIAVKYKKHEERWKEDNAFRKKRARCHKNSEKVKKNYEDLRVFKSQDGGQAPTSLDVSSDFVKDHKKAFLAPKGIFSQNSTSYVKTLFSLYVTK